MRRLWRRHGIDEWEIGGRGIESSEGERILGCVMGPRCLSFERRRVATRAAILAERTKQWLPLEQNRVRDPFDKEFKKCVVGLRDRCLVAERLRPMTALLVKRMKCAADPRGRCLVAKQLCPMTALRGKCAVGLRDRCLPTK